jgi:hypothetical protein
MECQLLRTRLQSFSLEPSRRSPTNFTRTALQTERESVRGGDASVKPLVELLTRKGELVVDPFAGMDRKVARRMPAAHRWPLRRFPAEGLWSGRRGPRAARLFWRKADKQLRHEGGAAIAFIRDEAEEGDDGE